MIRKIVIDDGVFQTIFPSTKLQKLKKHRNNYDSFNNYIYPPTLINYTNYIIYYYYFKFIILLHINDVKSKSWNIF